MESHHDPAFTRSGLERRFLKLAREAGLPRPSANLFVAGYELDMYWPRERFAVELDTYDYHGDRVRFESDRVRDESLRLAGIEVTRITGKRLDREPTAVMERLALLLSNRRVRV
jgi:very-short-patch-repair endonuclease